MCLRFLTQINTLKASSCDTDYTALAAADARSPDQMAEAIHPAAHPLAPDHLPGFITAPGDTDVLFYVMLVVLVVVIVMFGVLYLRLHALPEHMAHGTSKVQMEVVAVLCLVALFTHNHAFWIVALFLALIPIPDFSTPLAGMADSLAKMARRRRTPPDLEVIEFEPPPQESLEPPPVREVKGKSHA